MPPPSPSPGPRLGRGLLAGVAVGLLLFTPAGAGEARPRGGGERAGGRATVPIACAHALVLTRGRALAGGHLRGSATLTLERAAGGDTPVLSLRQLRHLSQPGQPATESGGAGLRLLLDTGAATSLVTPALVRRLGLRSEPLPPGSLDLAGGGVDCAGLTPRRTRLPDLVVGESGGGGEGLRLMGLEALVLPVPALPEGVDGVLGAPTLRRLPIRIEPAAQRLLLGSAALQPPLPVGARRLPLRWRHGVPLLTLASTAGPIGALADTGAEGLFLAPSLAGRLRPLDSPQVLRLVGFCGEQTVWRQRFDGLQRLLPPQGSVEGIVTDNPIFRQLGVEAIVGQELLRGHGQLWRLDASPPQLLLW